MIAPARRAAFDALVAVARMRADLPDAIAQARARLADERDRALLVEIATGTTRMQAAIDHVLSGVSNRPLRKLDLEVLVALRLSVYQLLYLDRLPASAVVDDGVALVKAARKTSAGGFVNAALRSFTRTRHAVRFPSRPEDPVREREAAIDYLATTLSHPRWLVERWLNRWGFEATERACLFDNGPAPLTLRANTLRVTRQALADRLRGEDVETTPTRYAPVGLVVRSGQPLALPWASEGWFVAQDEASQLVPLLAAAGPGDRVLDACAAPGGKTLVLAAASGESGLVVAADVRSGRVTLLRETLRRAGAIGRVAVVQADAAGGLPFGPAFDRVIVDAPCSGLGVLRREADIKWRRRPEDLPALSSVQRDIIRHAARVVRPGGRLVYSTCSTEPEENEDVVAAFERDTPSFERVGGPALRRGLPEAAHALVADDGAFRTTPWGEGLEGFYGVVLTRRT
jgi:16S rRNA (cytosine967-C5)-methyltransferase